MCVLIKSATCSIPYSPELFHHGINRLKCLNICFIEMQRRVKRPSATGNILLQMEELLQDQEPGTPCLCIP